MTKEKLVEKIMEECLAEGEPVTKEEAEEMAEMEIKSGLNRHYEQSEKPRKAAKKERKIDEIKREIIETIAQNLDRCFFGEELSTVVDMVILKPEKEITFKVGEDEYSVTLTKHRSKKGEK